MFGRFSRAIVISPRGFPGLRLVTRAEEDSTCWKLIRPGSSWQRRLKQ